MKVKDFVGLFLFGIIEGLSLNGLSDFAFEVFVSRSFIGYLLLLFVILALILSFVVVPKLFEGNSKF